MTDNTEIIASWTCPTCHDQGGDHGYPCDNCGRCYGGSPEHTPIPIHWDCNLCGGDVATGTCTCGDLELALAEGPECPGCGEHPWANGRKGPCPYCKS